MAALHVLLVEDSPADAGLVEIVLEDADPELELVGCSTLADALAVLSEVRVDVALIDLTLPDAEGLEAVARLRAAAPDLPLVVLTGLSDDEVALEALAAGAQDFLRKDELQPRLVLRSLRYAVERARADAAVRAAARWTASLLDGLESPTCAVDADGSVVVTNAAMTHSRSALFRAGEGEDLRAVLWSGPPPVHADALRDGLDQVLAGHLPRMELECPGADGRWWSVRTTPLPGGGGAVLTQVDVTDLKRAQEALVAASLHDRLTGLPNRTLLQDRLCQAFAYAARMGRSVAVVFLDVDRFKVLNDTFGQAAGDEALVALAGRLTAACRAGETVARVSGDEFVVAAIVGNDGEARDVAERVLAAACTAVVVDAGELSLSASAGLAVAGRSETPEEVLRAADEAMHAAKSRGGGRLEVASAELRGHLAHRLEVEAELDAALAEQRLEVHYQPVVRLADGVVTGVEALVRLRRADGSLLMPAEFVELAEISGQIVALGTAVLDEACREAASWSGPDAALTVAVNLSTRQLTAPDVVATVAASLVRSGLDASRLVLEVTESAVATDGEAALSALTALKALGLRIAIDDFGTGWSSFLYLKRFPVDVMKIDRSFVSGVLDSPDDAAIVASVVRLGLDLGVTLVAEGVETDEQRRHLAALGCTEAQGYLFSRPVAASELPAALRRTVTARVPDPRPPASLREVAERVSALHRTGASVHTIAALLNAEDVPSPSGRRWHPRSVAGLLDSLSMEAPA